MFSRKIFVSAALAAITGFGFTAGPSAADEVADFYKGKRITMLVGSGPGGGYDTYARLIARHMGRHIPGNPNFITQNKNGAASVIATNYMVNVAPRAAAGSWAALSALVENWSSAS